MAPYGTSPHHATGKARQPLPQRRGTPDRSSPQGDDGPTMTSLLPAPRRTRSAGEARADAAHRRPLVVLATLAGIAAAASTLLVCLAAGVIGWFLTDAGAHGAPRDGLRVGALGWLMAHGSGITVAGTHVSAVPLGLTLLAAVVVWRLGQRVRGSLARPRPGARPVAGGGPGRAPGPGPPPFAPGAAP